MKPCVAIAAILALSACVSFEPGVTILKELHGQDRKEAFAILGTPDADIHLDDKVVYVWSNGRAEVFDYKANDSVAPVVANLKCRVEVKVDSASGVIEDTLLAGNYGACRPYLKRLERSRDH
ncbi:hypothetical protein [Parvularcula sp. LCG005]|uniref:hypothetical protein n=1 Tax=Parvularcula sp. LCG005 TaxID=3078805 RepID=UPI002943D6D1|nr:hypothetical protein [Parvularcula sp. LCG005]WOI54316.1 hypothetical protein RUI03_04770 [Parvularcula sp. LCG005]